MNRDQLDQARMLWEREKTPEAAAQYIAVAQRYGMTFSPSKDSEILDQEAVFRMESQHKDLFERLPDNKQGRPEFLHKQTQAVFVMLPAGEYQMGSTEGDRDEQPIHRVVIDYPVLMQKHPMTQEQWERVMGQNPSHFKRGGSHPVESVSWHDCHKFIERTKDANGERGLELPSETIWEYACRAGTNTRFHSAADEAPGEGGDDESHLAKIAVFGRSWDEGHDPCYDENGNPTRQPNDWGLCHMLGQVWEWCEDEYHDSYAKAPPDSRAWNDAWDKARAHLIGEAMRWEGILAVEGEDDEVFDAGPNFPQKIEGTEAKPGDRLTLDDLNAFLLHMIARGALRRVESA